MAVGGWQLGASDLRRRAAFASLPPMRNFLALASFVTVLVLSGCDEYRETMMVVPDRQGHAASAEGAQSKPGISNTAVAHKGEMYITLGAQDTLSSVAKAYGVTLEWLIKRNRLTNPPKAGDNLIVPQGK